MTKDQILKIIEELFYLPIEQLSLFENIEEDMYMASLLFFLQGIKEKQNQEPFIEKVRKYIRLSLLIYRESGVKIDVPRVLILYPNFNCILTENELRYYIMRIKEGVNIEKMKKNDKIHEKNLLLD